MPPTGNERADIDTELSNSDIALLCDIGDAFPDTLSAEKRAQLDRLIARGFVEAASAEKAMGKYQLTAKATKILTERGVGLNESYQSRRRCRGCSEAHPVPTTRLWLTLPADPPANPWRQIACR